MVNATLIHKTSLNKHTIPLPDVSNNFFTTFFGWLIFLCFFLIASYFIIQSDRHYKYNWLIGTTNDRNGYPNDDGRDISIAKASGFVETANRNSLPSNVLRYFQSRLPADTAHIAILVPDTRGARFVSNVSESAIENTKSINNSGDPKYIAAHDEWVDATAVTSVYPSAVASAYTPVCWAIRFYSKTDGRVVAKGQTVRWPKNTVYDVYGRGTVDDLRFSESLEAITNKYFVRPTIIYDMPGWRIENLSVLKIESNGSSFLVNAPTDMHFETLLTSDENNDGEQTSNARNYQNGKITLSYNGICELITHYDGTDSRSTRKNFTLLFDRETYDNYFDPRRTSVARVTIANARANVMIPTVSQVIKNNLRLQNISAAAIDQEEEGETEKTTKEYIFWRCVYDESSKRYVSYVVICDPAYLMYDRDRATCVAKDVCKNVVAGTPMRLQGYEIQNGLLDRRLLSAYRKNNERIGFVARDNTVNNDITIPFEFDELKSFRQNNVDNRYVVCGDIASNGEHRVFTCDDYDFEDGVGCVTYDSCKDEADGERLPIYDKEHDLYGRGYVQCVNGRSVIEECKETPLVESRIACSETPCASLIETHGAYTGTHEIVSGNDYVQFLLQNVFVCKDGLVDTIIPTGIETHDLSIIQVRLDMNSSPLSVKNAYFEITVPSYFVNSPTDRNSTKRNETLTDSLRDKIINSKNNVFQTARFSYPNQNVASNDFILYETISYIANELSRHGRFSFYSKDNAFLFEPMLYEHNPLEELLKNRMLIMGINEFVHIPRIIKNAQWNFDRFFPIRHMLTEHVDLLSRNTLYLNPISRQFVLMCTIFSTRADEKSTYSGDVIESIDGSIDYRRAVSISNGNTILYDASNGASPVILQGIQLYKIGKYICEAVYGNVTGLTDYRNLSPRQISDSVLTKIQDTRYTVRTALYEEIQETVTPRLGRSHCEHPSLSRIPNAVYYNKDHWCFMDGEEKDKPYCTQFGFSDIVPPELQTTFKCTDQPLFPVYHKLLQDEKSSDFSDTYRYIGINSKESTFKPLSKTRLLQLIKAHGKEITNGNIQNWPFVRIIDKQDTK